eukprot:364478-Chlamydomonas_euryale.AAC.16
MESSEDEMGSNAACPGTILAGAHVSQGNTSGPLCSARQPRHMQGGAQLPHFRPTFPSHISGLAICKGGGSLAREPRPRNVHRHLRDTYRTRLHPQP